jgi:DNA-binding MarR family transcriptional regulator
MRATLSRVRLFVPESTRARPADVITALFVAHRQILKALRHQILRPAGLSPELAELLNELYLARPTVSPASRSDHGFVPLQKLLAAIDYTPGLLSRRIGILRRKGWIETKRVPPAASPGSHGNCRMVRITPLGREKIEPVRKKFQEQAEILLSGVSAVDLAAHCRISFLLAERLGPPRCENAPELKLESVNIVKPAKKTVAPAAPPAVPPSSPSVAHNFIGLEKEFLD